MVLTVNGEKRELPDGICVRDMLASFKLEGKILVVEVNREIVDRSLYDAAVLHDGDQVEIVHFVGGG